MSIKAGSKKDTIQHSTVNRKNYPRSQYWISWKLEITKKNGYKDDLNFKAAIAGSENRIDQFEFSPVVRVEKFAICFARLKGHVPSK